MSESTIQMVRNVARGMWWKLPAGHQRDDIEQEALLGAMQAPAGCQVRAARFAVIHYLRKWYPGSRSGRPARVMAAVDALPVEELEAIRALFYEGQTQRQYARRCGRSVASVQRLQYKAFSRIRRRLSA